MPDGPSRRLSAAHGLPALLLAAAAVLPYLGALDAPFVLDDVPNLQDNAALRWQELSWEGLRRAAFESPTTRPVAYWSFALQYRLGAGDPAGYRALNLAIHALNSLLVYALAFAALGRAGPPLGRRSAALAAGLVFAVHPLQVQSVTYVVQRMNALAAAFSLLALLLWVAGRGARRPRRRRLCWLAGAACFALALGSKENAAVLPFAVWLWEWFFERDLDRAWLRRSLPGLAAGLLLLAAAAAAASHGFRDYALQDFDMGERLLTQLRVFWIYLGLAFLPLPSRLSVLHEVAPSASLFEPGTTALALAGLAALGLAGVALARRFRVEVFGAAWFALFLAPESTLLPLAMLYEHRTYLPLAGLALAVASLVRTALPRRAAAGLLAALALSLALATQAHNQVWRDPVRLWSRAVAASPTSWRAHDELGLALVAAGRDAEAEGALRRAAELAPARRVDPLVHLAFLRARQGAADEALELLTRALRADPGSARAQHTLGRLLLERGRAAEAVAPLARAAALRPRDPAMRGDLGRALLESGRFAAGRAALEQALRLDPGSTRILNDLAWLLATGPEAGPGDAGRAVRLAERAVRLAERSRAGAAAADPALLDTLAAAYAEAGRFAEAEAAAARALELAVARGDARAAEAIRGRLERYRRSSGDRDGRAGE